MRHRQEVHRRAAGRSVPVVDHEARKRELRGRMTGRPEPVVKPAGASADYTRVEASEYALVQGMRSTRAALATWRTNPRPVIRSWLLGSFGAAGLLLVAVAVVALVSRDSSTWVPPQPPFVVGGPRDVLHILVSNGLVLALHAMACVAGFIAGSSLPLQADRYTGRMRLIHERGPAVAIGFVVCATAFSLSMQAYTIGRATAQDAVSLHASRLLLLAGVLPHALPELVALFLPLAAWILASRRGEWDRLLAATVVTVALAVPILIVSAVWEVYVAPHVLGALVRAPT